MLTIQSALGSLEMMLNAVSGRQGSPLDLAASVVQAHHCSAVPGTICMQLSRLENVPATHVTGLASAHEAWQMLCMTHASHFLAQLAPAADCQPLPW